jgi:hypothetical protein
MINIKGHLIAGTEKRTNKCDKNSESKIVQLNSQPPNQ